MAADFQPTFELDFRWLGRVEYSAALDLQTDLVDERRTARIGNTILLLEHDPVFTIGRTRDRSSLNEIDSLPHPVVEINRGGKATYHGPGQLVGYPILDLAHFGKDLHLYMRVLEEALIAACGEYEVPAESIEGLTGVWCRGAKLASIGVGVRQWVSMHGFAINICGDLTPFSTIVPCGLENVSITNLAKEARREITVEEFGESLRPHLRRSLEKIHSPARESDAGN